MFHEIFHRHPHGAPFAIVIVVGFLVMAVLVLTRRDKS
jgi:hypothetical protein